MAPKKGPRPMKGFLARMDHLKIIGAGAASSSDSSTPIAAPRLRSCQLRQAVWIERVLVEPENGL